ncbi:MAG: glycosyltransferase family 2 protein [Leptolyngbyaceae bacterium]|nr:glycosyltransferase family 2 protein [Leptolyngbyaceae bacterium]
MSTCPISVVIPTYNRPNAIRLALQKIYACDPCPDDVVIHIDANDIVTQQVLEHESFPSLTILQSQTQMGPGGGRNRAIAAAKNELIASFDDDSYPLDHDYFHRLITLFEMFPQASVIGANIFHIGEDILPDTAQIKHVHDFVGCGCAYRKRAFLQTTGYVPLAVAYGMEEVDLSLQLCNIGWDIYHSAWLRVFHDTHLIHHSSSKVTAASIANLALLAYLRYPMSFWWLGFAQCANRIVWLLTHQRFKGIFKGIESIPSLIYRYRRLRQPVTHNSLNTYLSLRRSPGSPINFKHRLATYSSPS